MRTDSRTRLPWWATGSTQPVLTPQQVRRYTLRGVISTALALALVTAAGCWVLLGSAVQDVTVEEGMLAHKQSNDALIGGCGRIYRFPDATAESGIVPRTNTAGEPNRIGYRTIVPIRGPFWSGGVGKRTWTRDAARPPGAERLMRNMWDGDMVVYYNDDVTSDDVATLLALSRTRPALRLFVAPWDAQLRGPLPKGRTLAFATWNTSQSCHTLAVTALYDFREAAPVTDAPGADGTNPPVLRRTRPPASPTD